MDQDMEEPADELVTPEKEDHGHAQQGRFHINRRLLPVKGFYFFFLAAVGSLLPFFAIYMKSLNLTAEETGIMYGCMPFFGFFIRPIIGALADRWRKHKLMLILCTVLTGVFYPLVLTVPARALPKLTVHSQLDCNIHDSYFRDCIANNDPKPDESTCHYGLSQLAEKANLTNATDVDCELRCSESEVSVSKGVEVCFTNSRDPFVNQCNGSHVKARAFTFKLKNLSHVLNNEVLGDRIIRGMPDCRDYDLKSLEYEARSDYWQLLCDDEGTFDCEMTCSNLPSSLCQARGREFDATFGWLFLIIFIANMAFAPVFSLADAAAFDTLGKEHHKFGQQRLWGTLGFALFAVLSTFIMYVMTKQDTAVDYTVCFYIFIVLSCVSAGVAYFLDLSCNIKCSSLFRNFVEVIKVPEVSVFLVVVIVFGMAFGAIDSFLFWFLSDLGATTLVFGFSLLLNCIFEVPSLFISGRILKRIGPAMCLYIALVVMAVRFFAYSILSNPWYVLLVEPLHGVTFGIMWPACTSKAAQIAPPGMSATIQGIVGGVHFGIGRGVGSIVMGALVSNIGARWSFRTIAFLLLFMLLVYALLNQLFWSSRTAPNTQEAKSEDDRNNSPNSQPLLDAGINNSIDHGGDQLDSPANNKA